MELRKLLLGPIAAAAMMFGQAGGAQAATAEYELGTLLTGEGPSFASFATLAVETTDNMTFNFRLSISDDLNTLFGDAGTFVSQLWINTATNADLTSTQISAGSWGVAEVRVDTTPSNTASIAWDFMDSFCGSKNACNPNNANSRLTQGEEVRWTTIFSTATSFGLPEFQLKVQGFNGLSGEYVPGMPVPEPEIYAMLIAGLGLMGFMARRRRARFAVA